ncbi:reverse transcriptase domain-containing protein [Tanacetum coccineum]|uniref:Reverse transcriptase domain-containing protein n=1 Tax=Tanacetum coccineum TaxID=301880 RepID=A0ABQ5GBE5_9ASTR
MNGNRKEWADKLDDALWAFKIAYKSPIGSNPFRIVYGKACHLPIDMEHKAYWALKNVNLDLDAARKHSFTGSHSKEMEFEVTSTYIQVVVHDKEFTKELFTPFKNPKQEFHSFRKLFKTHGLDESSLPEFDLFSDLEENSEEGVAEIIAETMEEYMCKTRSNYGSGVSRPKIDDKYYFELKGQFLKELRDNSFNGSDHEDANEHIERVLETVDLFHIPNITQD